MSSTSPTVATLSTMAASTSPSPQSTSAESLNFFARLPAELRLMVYGHLGYPVSKHLWIDCPGHPECQDNSHIVDHRDADWPISWHTHPGVFEIRISVKHVDIRMSNGEQRVILGPVGVRGVMKWVNGKETMVSYIPPQIGDNTDDMFRLTPWRTCPPTCLP
jgi:hypothetical protein